MFLDNLWAGLGGMVLPLSLGFLPFFLCWLFLVGLRLPFFPWFRQFNLPSPSPFSLTPKEGICSWGLVKFFFGKGKRRKGMLLGTCSKVVELSLGRRKEQEHATHFGKREGDKSMQLVWGRVSLSLSLSPYCIYTPFTWKKGVFGRWTKVVLIPLLGYPWASFHSPSHLK